MSTTSSRASLLDLPDELLLIILNYASPTLYGTTLANRRLYALSKPFLYSKFSYDTWAPDLFLRTICQNQDLARHVKEITLSYNIRKAEELSLAPEKVARYQQIRLDIVSDALVEISARGNKFADYVQGGLRPGQKYLGDLRGLYLLLLFTSNIEHLEIYDTYEWDKSVYWFMPFVYHRGDALSRLTSVTLRGPIRLQNIAALMFVPSMRRLELTEVTEMIRERSLLLDHSRPWHDVLNMSKSCIEHLYLYRSYIKLSGITQVFKSIKGLKTFVYEHVSPARGYAILYAPLDVQILGILAKFQAHALKTFKVVDKVYHSPFVGITATYEIMESLHEVVDLELTHVQLATFLAPEWQNLPASLTNLSLDFLALHSYDATKELTDLEMCLERLVARKIRGDLPNLRTLTVKQWHPWYGCIPKNVTHVKSMLQNAGIDFFSIPDEIGRRFTGDEDIGWVELQTEPGWVFLERFIYDPGRE